MQGRVAFISISAYGAVGDGTRDDQGAIRDAIDAAMQVAVDHPGRRAVVVCPDGVYRVKSTINMKSNVTVMCSPGCVFLADKHITFDRVVFHGVTDATWIGGIFLRADNTVTGNVFDINSDDNGNRSTRILIKDVTIRGWTDTSVTPPAVITGWVEATAIAVVGDDVRIVNPTIMNPDLVNGAAQGVRVSGGRNFLCTGGYVEGGDDPIGFIPRAVRSNDTTGDNSIEDGAFVDMIVKGFGSRIINFALSANSMDNGVWQFAGTSPMVYQISSIRRCRVANILAISSAKRCVQIHNGSSSGVIEDVEIADVLVTCGAMSEVPVSIANYAGGVRRVFVRNLTLNAAAGATVDQAMMEVVRVDDRHRTGRGDRPDRAKRVRARDAAMRERGDRPRRGEDPRCARSAPHAGVERD